MSEGSPRIASVSENKQRTKPVPIPTGGTIHSRPQVDISKDGRTTDRFLGQETRESEARMLPITRRFVSRGQSRVGTCGSLRHPPGATLESLEPRRLLTFAAPVSYNIGSLADGFVPNAAPINVV